MWRKQVFCKHMPAHTYINEEAKCMPVRKVLKDRLILLLRENIADFHLKPILLHHTKH